MQKLKTAKLLCVVSLALIILSSGCSTSYMKVVPSERAVFKPEQDKAMMVFMRATAYGGAIQSSVFEIIDDKALLVGIVSAKKKVACSIAPGEHLFMVIGENADFMSANVQAGKAYYALVTPRMGMWKARFSLKPIKQEELQSKDFKKWQNSCKWVENTPKSIQWAESNMNSILKKYQKYYPKWMDKSESARPRLMPQDGL